MNSWATDYGETEEDANDTEAEGRTSARNTDSDIAQLQSLRRNRSARHRHSPYEKEAA